MFSREKLISVLKDTFEIDNVILIPWDELDEYGHSDGMLRFIDENKVLINGIYDSNKNFKRKLLLPLEKNGINYEWLKFDVKMQDPRNCVFINYLQTSDLILVPKLNIEEDNQAFDQIKKHFPTYEANKRILQVDLTAVEKFGGGLNCISWTIKT